MSVIVGKSQAYNTILDIVKTFLDKKAAGDAQIEQIRLDRDLRVEAIQRKTHVVLIGMETAQAAALKRLSEVKTDFETFAKQMYSPIAISEDRIVSLSGTDRDAIASLDYFDVDIDTLARIADYAAARPECVSLRAALVKKARELGFEVIGLYTPPAEEIETFTKACNLAERILSIPVDTPTRLDTNGADLWITEAQAQIEAMMQSSYIVDDMGRTKPIEYEIRAIPQTDDEKFARYVEAHTERSTAPEVSEEQDIELQSIISGTDKKAQNLAAKIEQRRQNRAFEEKMMYKPQEQPQEPQKNADAR